MDKMYKKRHRQALGFATESSGLKQYNLTWWHDESKLWPVFPLAIEETIRTSERPPFSMEHEWLMISLMLKGSHSYEFKSANQISLHEHELCIIPPACKYLCHSDAGYHKIVVMFDGMLIKETCNIFNMVNPIKISISNTKEIEAMIRVITKLMNEGKKSNTPEILGLTQKLLSELSIMLASAITSSNHKLFSDIQNYLSMNFDQKITMKDIASTFNISCSFIQKLFRKYSQTSPMQYRITKKLERACYFLTYTDQSIKEISFQLGYDNQHYFANDFKKHYKLTPTKYRKG